MICIIYIFIHHIFFAVTFETEDVEIIVNHDSGDQLMTNINKHQRDQEHLQCSAAVKKIN